MRLHHYVHAPLSVLIALSIATPAAAADEHNKALTDQTAAVTAQAALVEAQAKLVAQQAALTQAKIDSLGLPTFEGNTELSNNAGAMESNLLAATALAKGAKRIAADIKTKNLASVIVLTGDEKPDFGAAAMLRTQMEAIDLLFDHANVPDQAKLAATSGIMSSFAPGLIIPAITAVAGLLRSDTKVDGVETSAITANLAVAAVAAQLPGAIIPSEIVANARAEKGSLLALFNKLEDRRGLAQARLDAGGTKLGKSAKAMLSLAIARFDTFAAKATAPDDTGAVPLVTAARLERVLDENSMVLRIFVNKAAGSIVNTKNIWTTFGVDPVKVSGGVIMSYTLANPRTGMVETGDMLFCSSALTSLRKIQEGNWRPSSQAATDPRNCISAKDS